MKKALLRLLLASAFVAAAPVAQSTVVSDFGPYSLSYDETTIFGLPFATSDGTNTKVIGWHFPANAIAATAASGSSITRDLPLPSFTLTANPGYVLSGPVSSFFGNLAYSEFNGGATSVQLSGLVSVNSAPATQLVGFVFKNPTDEFTGFYSGTGGGPAPAFNSFQFSGGLLSLTASAPVGGFATVSAQSQNLLTLSFTAMPVPEAEGYLMMLAGLGMLGAIMRRRATPA